MTKGGVMHDGLTAMILGLGTIPSGGRRCDDIARHRAGRSDRWPIAYDACLDKGSVDAIRRAKARKIRISAEVTLTISR